MRRVLGAAVLSVVLLCGPAVVSVAGASDRLVVQGTGDPGVDLAAVQGAVDQAATVILDGTFDFGGGTLSLAQDGVTLRGREGASIVNGGDPTIEAAGVGVRLLDLSITTPTGVAVVVPGDGATVRDNMLNAPSTVLVLGDQARVARNTISFSAFGVVVFNGVDATIRDNSVWGDNTPGGGSAIEVFDAAGSRVANSDVVAKADAAGVVVNGGQDHRISHNTVTGGIDGIVTFSTEGTTIRDNTVLETTGWGIVTFDGVGMRLRDNVLHDVDSGILLNSAQDSVVTGNDINLNDADGIVGDPPIPFFALPTVGIALYGQIDFLSFPPSVAAASVGNRVTDNDLSGTMAFGYVVDAEARMNRIVIDDDSLDDVTLLTPPVDFGCTPAANGADVLLTGGRSLTPDSSGSDEIGPTTQNVVVDETGSALIFDCGLDNSIHVTD